MNLARLNHVFIPATRDARERLRRSFLGKLFRPGAWLYGALTDEGRVLLVLMMFVGTAGLGVGTTQVYVLWSALTGIMAASLLVRFFYRLRDVDLEVRGPARVAAGNPVTFELLVHNRSAADVHCIRLRGPFLPWDGRWLSPPPPIACAEQGRTARSESRAIFVARGEHQLDVFSAGAVVPGALTLGPLIRSEPFRFIVVPPIANVVHVALPMGSRYQPGGVARASRIGEALELIGVRPYRAGDPVRDLHPKTWARSGRPHVREYQQEFFTRIGVFVDNDKTAGSEEGFEALVSLTAGIVSHLSRGEALIDLLVIGERIHALTIGRSLGFFEQALDHLACATRDDPTDLDELASRLEPFLARLSALVIVTQSSDPTRARLADALERRGIPCRIVRVRDRAWLGRFSNDSDGPSEPRECMVASDAIVRGEAVTL
jgi:uncharacterized protein (DUF58 family)